MGKNLYITTAIPYVNAAPHIGNAMDYLYADIWARYQKQQHPDRLLRFAAGTDEHGNKIAAKAKEQGVSPQQYTDGQYKAFADLMKKLGANYTDFVRTTDEHHQQTIQHIWEKLQPYIYKVNTKVGTALVTKHFLLTKKLPKQTAFVLTTKLSTKTVRRKLLFQAESIWTANQRSNYKKENDMSQNFVKTKF